MSDPLPPTQFDSIEDGLVVRTTAEKVQRYNKVTNRLEVCLVGLAALALIGLGIQATKNSARVRQISEQNNKLLKAQAAGQQFGIDAVNCIRYVITEHRYVNEEYHHEQAIALHLPIPAHSELGRRPTNEEIEKACKPFEGNPEPPQVNPPTTRKGK